MKKVITQRSIEERAKFFKKNLHKVQLGESSSTQKAPVSVHQLVENPPVLDEPADDFSFEDSSLDFEEEE